MTKKDIVVKISDQTGIKQVIVKKIVHKVFDTVLEVLKEGRRIEIRNFGVFEVKKRKARMGRNPRTNEPVRVPERKQVVFKPGLEMNKKIR